MVTINKQSKSTFFSYISISINLSIATNLPEPHVWKVGRSLSLSRKTTAGKNQLELCINRRLLHIRFEVGRSSSPLLPVADLWGARGALAPLPPGTPWSPWSPPKNFLRYQWRKRVLRTSGARGRRSFSPLYFIPGSAPACFHFYTLYFTSLYSYLIVH